MTPRYRVCGLGADGLLVDTRAAAADCLVWRGPYAVAVELAGLADELSKHGADDRVRWVLDRARQRAANFDADTIGRELGRALVQAQRSARKVVVL